MFVISPRVFYSLLVLSLRPEEAPGFGFLFLSGFLFWRFLFFTLNNSLLDPPLMTLVLFFDLYPVASHREQFETFHR